MTEDVNADGKTDVVLGSGVLLLGNGDGTLTAGTPLFTSVVTPVTPPPAYALLTAPPTATIPGGEDDPFFALVYINLQAGANAVFIPNIGSGATVTALLAPGTYSLTAHYSGDATYAAIGLEHDQCDDSPGHADGCGDIFRESQLYRRGRHA